MTEIRGIYAASVSIFDDNLNLDINKTILYAENLINCKGCHGFSGEGLYGPELVGRSSLSGENISDAHDVSSLLSDIPLDSQMIHDEIVRER